MLENIVADPAAVEQALKEIAPSGFTLTLNVRHFVPQFYVSTYPEEWIETYTRRHYAIHDPVTLWCATNNGKIRWSEIGAGYHMAGGRRVIDESKKFNLNFGTAISTKNVDNNSKCALFGSRPDREMSDTEINILSNILQQAIAGVGALAGLTEVELESLRDLANGMTHQEIATFRGISAAAVKKRIERARHVLGARNAVHAVSIATRRGLIIQDALF